MGNFELQDSLINAIYQESPEGILVVDDKEVIVSHNHQFVEIWRLPNDLLNGLESDSAIGLDDAPILAAVLNRVKDAQAFLARVKELYDNPHLKDHCEIELLDGRTVERHSAVLYSKDGRLLGRVWFFRDITSQKQVEATLKELTRQDPLTGVANRRYFFERANLEFARTKRYLNPLSIALLDIDYFKQINDKNGHAVGDEILKSVCSCSQSLLRQVDVFARIGGEEVFARIGGEEFAVLLPDTNLNQATHVAERLRRAIADIKLLIKNGEVSCTVSIGVATLGLTDTCIEDCLLRADNAMYRAKHNGRNRVEIEA
jgi:GGDEF domain-containing protein